MPTSLLTAASRLIGAGATVELYDENISPARLNQAIVGVNLVGAPYVEPVRQLAQRLERPDQKLALGGQVVSGFSPAQRQELFGESAINGNDDVALVAALGLAPSSLPPVELVSLIPGYRLLPAETMRLYLQSEFGFFLSQGCRFNCTFCAAERTRNIAGGGVRVVREMYRRPDVVETDLGFLADAALEAGISTLQIYLSNLDLFQTPSRLEEFADVATRVGASRPALRIRMRGLSTAASFLEVHRSQPELIERLVSAGLERIGFGVDGAAAQVWKATRKPQAGSMCIDAIVSARTCYGLTPETLMVFGHIGVDNRQSLAMAAEFTRDMWERFGAVPRPHVAKSVVPGNDGWWDPVHGGTVAALMAWPSGFQALDFTALPSPLTHPDGAFRELATEYFLEVCSLEGAITKYVLPEYPGLSEETLEEVRDFNRGRYDI